MKICIYEVTEVPTYSQCSPIKIPPSSKAVGVEYRTNHHQWSRPYYGQIISRNVKLHTNETKKKPINKLVTVARWAVS